jgi:hypothetical protein
LENAYCGTLVIASQFIMIPSFISPFTGGSSDLVFKQVAKTIMSYFPILMFYLSRICTILLLSFKQIQNLRNDLVTGVPESLG